MQNSTLPLHLNRVQSRSSPLVTDADKSCNFVFGDGASTGTRVLSLVGMDKHSGC
jgi:hypothetical protein